MDIVTFHKSFKEHIKFVELKMRNTDSTNNRKIGETFLIIVLQYNWENT